MKKSLFSLIILIFSVNPLSLYGLEVSYEPLISTRAEETTNTPLNNIKERIYPENLFELSQNFKQFSSQCHSLQSLNFGVVINNDHYQIYRSKALGERGIYRLFAHLRENELATPDRVIFMNKDGYKKTLLGNYLPFLNKHFKSLDNFAYQEALLFSEEGDFSDIAFYHPLNAPVYLNGKNPVRDTVYLSTARLIDEESREFFSEQSEDNALVDTIIGSKENLYYILELILGSEGASLFHCTGGLHRTGMIALAIRHLQGGHWIEPLPQPIHIKISVGTLFREITLTNLAEVEYFLHNRYQTRFDNLAAIEALVKEERFQAMRTVYQEKLNAPSRCD